MRTSPRSIITVDLDAVRHNVAFLRRGLRPGTRFLAVVKADGYGHGVTQCARAALQAGADGVAVATAEEAVALRDAGFTSTILVMGPLFGADQCLEMMLLGIECTIVSEEMIPMVVAAAASVGSATPAGATTSAAVRASGGAADGRLRARIHVKIDSGMNRQGLRPEAVPTFLEAIRDTHGIKLVGVMTHFPCAPEDPSSVDHQLERFLPIVRRVKEAYPAVLAHAANSAATMNCPHTHLDMVRCGIAVYGLSPTQGNAAREGLRLALSWTSQVALVKRVRAGEGVGYGHTYRCPADTDIALIPLGYADGVFRSLGNRGRVAIDGRSYPMVGRVSMDSFAVDVGTDGWVRPEQRVTLIGKDGDVALTAEDMAFAADTINYEVTCRLSLARAQRIFVGEEYV